MTLPEKGVRIEGDQFALRIFPRSEYDPHARCQLYVEDDGHWHTAGDWFSVHWINDLFNIVELAKNFVESLPKDKDGYHLFEIEP